MKGIILQAPENGEQGFISGSDENRYTFSTSDVKGNSVLKAGDEVDFSPNSGAACDIFVMQNQNVAQRNTNYTNKPPIKELWFTTGGRAPRYDYWVRGLLPLIGIAFAAMIMDMIIFGANALEQGETFFVGLTYLLATWVSIILTIKRLRDMDKNPWLALLLIVPIANLVIGVMVGFIAGTNGQNQYGPNPLS